MPCAVIVDPFSTGALLASAFRARGIRSIAVLTQPVETHYSGPSFRAGDFDTVRLCGESVATLADEIRSFKPMCVIPGCESGVEIADALCVLFDIFPNDPGLGTCRRNKFAMQARLNEVGLSSIAQTCVVSAQEALAWVHETGKMPVVVKPVRSAGSDNVWMCRSEHEVARRVAEVLASRNIIGEDNPAVLVQEYMDGVEFVVDAVSRDGIPAITNACRYVKDSSSGAFLYREVHVLAPDSQDVQGLLGYHADVLRALGVRFGASHAEIMLTATGPVLIECGARLHGGVTVPELVRQCCGISPVDILVSSYAAPTDHHNWSLNPPRFDHSAAVFVLANPRDGLVRSLDGLRELDKLRSKATAHINVYPGKKVRRTTDLYSSPGWISLLSHDGDAPLADIVTLRALEAAGRLVDLTEER